MLVHFLHKDDTTSKFPIKVLCRQFTQTEWLKEQQSYINDFALYKADRANVNCEACILIAMVQPNLVKYL